MNESEEGATALIEALLGGEILKLLVENLDRLDESRKDEADGVQNSLAIFENMSEFRPEICRTATDQGLLVWILKRLRSRIFDGNKLYASEILAIILQNDDESKRILGEIDGIDILLQQLANYKRHDPRSVDEIECMENLFNSLCASLLNFQNRKKFLDGEGPHLMNLMLREKKMSRESALKVLDYALQGPEGKENCEKFVEILGLRTIFPLFMKTPSKTKRKGQSAEMHEEHVCSIIASLFKNFTSLEFRKRIFIKFVEQDLSKSSKISKNLLEEIFFKYFFKFSKQTFKIELN